MCGLWVAYEKTRTAGDQSKPKRLLWLYANKNTAKRAVDREWERMQAAKEETANPTEGGV